MEATFMMNIVAWAFSVDKQKDAMNIDLSAPLQKSDC